LLNRYTIQGYKETRENKSKINPPAGGFKQKIILKKNKKMKINSLSRHSGIPQRREKFNENCKLKIEN